MLFERVILLNHSKPKEIHTNTNSEVGQPRRLKLREKILQSFGARNHSGILSGGVGYFIWGPGYFIWGLGHSFFAPIDAARFGHFLRKS